MGQYMDKMKAIENFLYQGREESRLWEDLCEHLEWSLELQNSQGQHTNEIRSGEINNPKNA